MYNFNSTIAAISTAPGVGAIGIVRLSGDHAVNIIEKVFQHTTPIQHRYACYGQIIDPQNSDVIDDVIVLYFQAPHSFTGEELIEVHSHGSPYVLECILSLLTSNGAVLAEPGEFTRRAFLNGKMDLLQAESVADIIHSQTEKSLHYSAQQLHGLLSQELLHLKDDLKKQAALLEIELDFSEDDIEFASRDELSVNIQQAISEAQKLVKTFRYGRIIQEGAKIVIAGEPNVGKSSVLNRLLLTDRAIVSDIPGTTRDTIEELLDIQGYLFRIVDTAGLRHSVDEIEQEGIKRTKLNLESADIILHVTDATQMSSTFALHFEPEDHQRVITLLNKIDLLPDRKEEPDGSIFVSAKTGLGFQKLEQALVDIVALGDEQDIVITKIRHKNALQKTIDYLQHAQESLNQQLSEEFIAMDLKAALDSLGELTGETTSDDILNDIFSKFCIGK